MSKYCWADVQSNDRACAEWKCWLDVHRVKAGIGRGCLALVSKPFETAGLVRNRTSLDGLKSLRSVVYVSDASPDRKKCGNRCLNLRGIRLGSCSLNTRLLL